MTPTLQATDNAPTTTEHQPADTRRITESDADYQRLHARTVRKLTASIATFVRELRRGEQGADTRFIHRHTSLLRDAYLAAHEAGQRDYWQSVSLRHDQPTVDPDPLLVQQRLSYFAAGSVLKMAQQGNAAKMAAGGHITQGEPSDGLTATTVRLEGIYLAGGDPDPLAAWQASTEGRVNLQGAIAWSGIQDGYLKGGVGDPANPFALLYWNLGIVKGDHCDDCKRLAFSSPYNAPGSGGNELFQTPGDGRTECGANCKCDLSYTPLAPLHEAELKQAVQQAQDWLDYQNQLRAQSLVPEGFTAQPSGASNGLPTFQPLWRQPGYGGPQGALLVPPNTTDLATAQKAALDAIRSAQSEWEAIRADHPDLPADPWYFSDNPNDPYAVPTIVASGTYEYAEEYAALRRLWDAQGLWLAANGVEPSDMEMAERDWDSVLALLLGDGPRTYVRDAKGRFANTGGRKPYEPKGRTRAAKEEQPTGGRGKGGGGGSGHTGERQERAPQASKAAEHNTEERAGKREVAAMHHAVVEERVGGAKGARGEGKATRSTVEEKVGRLGTAKQMEARDRAVERLYKGIPKGDPQTLQGNDGNPYNRGNEATKYGEQKLEETISHLAARLENNRSFQRLARYHGADEDAIAVQKYTRETFDHIPTTHAEAKRLAVEGAIYDMMSEFHGAERQGIDAYREKYAVNPFQVAFHEAVRAEFHLRGTKGYYTPEELATAKERYKGYTNGLRAFARAMHEETQDYFRQQGISEVTIYRGLRRHEEQVAKDTLGKPGRANIKTQVISSWSTAPDIAADYAFGRGAAEHTLAREYGMILAARVPVSHLLSTGFTGFGATTLREALVLGGESHGSAVTFRTSDHPTIHDIYRAFGGSHGNATTSGGRGSGRRSTGSQLARTATPKAKKAHTAQGTSQQQEGQVAP